MCEQWQKKQGEGNYSSVLSLLEVQRRVLNGAPVNTKQRVSCFVCCLQTECSAEALVFKGASS